MPTTALPSSVATTRCSAGVPGPSARHRSDRPSATGTCPFGGRSSVVCDWPGTLCRHLAWLGEPRTISSLVLDPPFGLHRQSYAPRRQSRGLLNADGWGVGFYVPGREEPARWRSAKPLWGDASFASLAPVIESGCVLAAVRSATVGMPLEETAAAPFT